MFKEIQLLTLKYNRIHKGTLTIAATAMSGFVFIISAYAIVGLSQNLVLPQIVFFLLLAFDTAVVLELVDGTLTAGVLKFSTAVLIKTHHHAATFVTPKRNSVLQKTT